MKHPENWLTLSSWSGDEAPWIYIEEVYRLCTSFQIEIKGFGYNEGESLISGVMEILQFQENLKGQGDQEKSWKITGLSLGSKDILNTLCSLMVLPSHNQTVL